MSGLPRPSGLQPLRTYKKSTTKVTAGGTSTTNIHETTTTQQQQGQGQRTLYAQQVPRGPSTAGASRIGQPSSRTTTTNVTVGGSSTTTSTTKSYGLPGPSRLPSAGRVPSSQLPGPPSRLGRPQAPQPQAVPPRRAIPAPTQPRVPSSRLGQQLSQGYATGPPAPSPTNYPAGLPLGPRPPRHMESGLSAPQRTSGLPRAPGALPRPRPASGIPSGPIAPRPQGAAPRPQGAFPRPKGANLVEKKSSKTTTVHGGKKIVKTTSSTKLSQGGQQQYYREDSNTKKENMYKDRFGKNRERQSILDVGQMITEKFKPLTPGKIAPPLKDYRLEPIQPGLVQEGRDEGEELQQHVEHELLDAAMKAPRKDLKATGTKQTLIKMPRIVGTDGEEEEATSEVIMKKSVIRSPGKPEILSRHMTSIEQMGRGQALRTDLEIQKLSPKKKSKFEVTDREVISVTDVVLMSPRLKLTSKTVTYDAPDLPPGEREPPMPSPEEIAGLVDEENAEVEKTLHMLIPDLKASRPVTYGVKKHMELQQLTADSVTLLQQSIAPVIPNADECQEEPPPELIATIMNTEERGMAMGSHPSNMHKYLFPDVTEAGTMVAVSSAMIAPLQNVVVPGRLPETLKAEMRTEEMMAAAIDIEAKLGEPIPDNIYVETVGKPTEPPKNTARGKRKIAKPLSEEPPPWGDVDMQPLAEVAGASMNVSVPRESQLNSPEVDIEYLLQMEAPKHTSRVQLRGSSNPSWFPGYLLALPDLSELITVVRSPSVVFTAAWRATQPDIFADESLLVV